MFNLEKLSDIQLSVYENLKEVYPYNGNELFSLDLESQSYTLRKKKSQEEYDLIESSYKQSGFDNFSQEDYSLACRYAIMLNVFEAIKIKHKEYLLKFKPVDKVKHTDRIKLRSIFSQDLTSTHFFASSGIIYQVLNQKEYSDIFSFIPKEFGIKEVISDVIEYNHPSNDKKITGYLMDKFDYANQVIYFSNKPFLQLEKTVDSIVMNENEEMVELKFTVFPQDCKIIPIEIN
jgi:hypothetical protein